MKLNRDNVAIIFIFLAALTIRLLFVLHSNNVPFADAAHYDQLSLSIANGEGYVNVDGMPHSIRPPFYPFFLALIFKVFGHNYLAVRVSQSIIGAFTCLLIFLIGKRAYGFSVGLFSAVISVWYFPFIKSAELLMTELIFTFFLCLIVYYLLRVNKEATLRNCIFLGLFLGVATLTRSLMMLFPFFLIPVFFCVTKINFFTNLKKYLIILLFFVLTITPWAIRNYIIYNEFIPVSTVGGFAIYSSYCQTEGVLGRNARVSDPIVAEGNSISSPSLRSIFFIKKTRDFILNNPRKFIELELTKFLYLWVPFDWEIVGGKWFNVIYVIVLPFFALGFFAAFKKFYENYPILLPVIYFQVMTLIFYGSPRFRLPTEPFIFMLAVTGVLQCRKWFFIKNKIFENNAINFGV